ncbi:hypothetical protein [Methylibium sp.]|uniref:hypothetical protein n=1 Tax=Methylibium sp. TaxID=2067992 RepID=UPI0025D2CA0D|nr:hypothetical protein [Methylibium sp.]
MVRDQMLCFVAPARAQDAAAIKGLIERLRPRFRKLFESAGCVHFASLALLPPRPGGEGAPRHPTLMLELVVDDALRPHEVIDALVKEDADALGSLYLVDPPEESNASTGLRDFLLAHVSRAAGGFLGHRDRSVRQVINEAVLFDGLRARFADEAESALVDSRDLARAAALWVAGQPAYDWAAQPAPRSFWRARWMGRWWRIVLVSLSLVLPAVLFVVSLMGVLAVGGVVAVWAGGLFVDGRALRSAVFGQYAGFAGPAIRLVVGVALAFLVIVTLGAKRLIDISLTFALLLALGVFLFGWPLLTPSYRMFSGALLALVGWGLLIAAGAVVTLAVAALALGAAVACVPPYLGGAAVAAVFVVLLCGAALGGHGALAWIAVSSSATHWPAVALLKDHAPLLGVPAVDAAVLMVAGVTLIGAVLAAGLSRGVLELGQMLNGIPLPRRGPVPRALQVHASIDDCEAALVGRPNHLISLTEIRRPYLWHRTMLRLWLGLVTRLGHIAFTQGRLGDAEGIQFGHWHIIDRGRRLLFCSNYDGSFGGYLDEFILGASQGVNLFWRWTELRQRAAAGPGHPAVEIDRSFPPTTMLAFRGCRHELWFKTYARDSTLPHLYRFEAYCLSNRDIDRATRLRDALSGKRTAVKDDEIMRTLES